MRYTPTVNAEIQEKGLRKVAALNGMRFYECPLSYVTSETHEVIRIVFLIDVSGHLLHAGGWGDQPSWLVEAYEIFKAEEQVKGASWEATKRLR